MVSKPQTHMQPVFLPPRATVYQSQPPMPSGNVGVSHIGSLSMSASVKRKQSPSPNSGMPPHSQPPSVASYHRQPPPGVQLPEGTMLGPRGGGDDHHRRSGDSRAVLWTSKPPMLRHEQTLPFVADGLQYRPGAIPGYPSSGGPPQGPPKQLYSFPIAIRPGGYHM